MPGEPLPRCRRTSWAEIDRLADAIARQVLDASRRPETIVALTRGGWVPARLLADRLGVSSMVSLRAQHWGVTATPTGAAALTGGLSGPVRGQSVLVVDDITDTGESLALATAHVKEQGAERVESAALLHIAHSTFLPTYHGETIPRDAWVWVVFPWNYIEDLRTLAQRAAAGGAGAPEVQARLRKECGLDIPIGEIAGALRALPESESPPER